jgi:putative membrane protein
MIASAATAVLAGSGGQGRAIAMLLAQAHPLVHLNAALNGLATILLILGYREIKRGREAIHGSFMLAALATSAAFLVSYVVYHASAGSVKFTHSGPVRVLYYAILFSHVVLAFTAPFFALGSAYLGARALGWLGGLAPPEEAAQYRARHRRLVRWAYPIWLYVSVTGVIVYVMLYHLWPPADI